MKKANFDTNAYPLHNYSASNVSYAWTEEYRSLLKQWPEFGTEEALDDYLITRNLKIPVWTASDIGAEENKLGLGGSPTQVYKVNFVVLETTESKEISPNQEGIVALIQELIQEYIVG